MIESKVPKDIRQYKTKLVGSFDLRQIICILIAIGIDAILYFTVVPLLGDIGIDSLVFWVALIDIPIFAFGWLHPDGMNLEVYINNVFLRQFLSPRKRKLKRIIYQYPKQQYTDNEKKASAQKVAAETSQHPEYKAYE